MHYCGAHKTTNPNPSSNYTYLSTVNRKWWRLTTSGGRGHALPLSTTSDDCTYIALFFTFYFIYFKIHISTIQRISERYNYAHASGLKSCLDKTLANPSPVFAVPIFSINDPQKNRTGPVIFWMHFAFKNEIKNQSLNPLINYVYAIVNTVD